jgi:hypothetical protein
MITLISSSLSASLLFQILLLGLYRHPIPTTEAVLPYVFTSPWADIIVRENDKMYLFGHPTVIRGAINEFASGFLTSSKGDLGLRSNIPLTNFSEFRQAMRQHMSGLNGSGGGPQLASIVSEGEDSSMKYVTNIQQYHDTGYPDPILEGRDDRDDRSHESKMDSGVQANHLPL